MSLDMVFRVQIPVTSSLAFTCARVACYWEQNQEWIAVIYKASGCPYLSGVYSDTRGPAFSSAGQRKPAGMFQDHPGPSVLSDDDKQIRTLFF